MTFLVVFLWLCGLFGCALIGMYAGSLFERWQKRNAAKYIDDEAGILVGITVMILLLVPYVCQSFVSFVDYAEQQNTEQLARGEE